MEKIFSIYLITNKINNKQYVGFTRKQQPTERFIEHVRLSNQSDKKTQSALHKAIKKYGSDNFSFEVIYQSPDGNHTLKVMEPHFIEKYNTYKAGYNCTRGGDGVLGFSSKLKGQKVGPQSKETCEKKRAIQVKLLERLTEEDKKSMYGSPGKKNPMFGKKHSNSARAKQRDVNLKYKYVLTSNTGQVFETDNLKEFCKNGNYNVGQMWQLEHGKCKKCKDIVAILKVPRVGISFSTL